MKRVLAMLAISTLVVGCAGRTAMYNAPDKNDQVAVVGVSSHLESGDGEAQSGGWQAPGGNQPARVGVFKVDGERTQKMRGADKARVRGGEHTIQVYADKAGSLRFGNITYEFQAGKTYDIRIYSNQSEATDYRAKLVNTAEPGHVLKEVEF